MPGLPSGRVDVVVPDRDPGVLVGDAPGVAAPRPDRRDWSSVRGASLTRASSHGAGRARSGAPRRAYPRRDDHEARRPPSVARPASQPRPRASRRCATSGSRCRDGLELSANLWLPEPLRRRPGRALPGDPRDDPVPQGRLARGERREPRRVARGARLRVLPARRPGHRARRRGSPSTSTRPARRRTATTRSSGWPPSRGRNGKVGMWGISLRRLHRDPGRDAPPAAPRGDRPDDGDRRPLHRRRPLPRRLRDGVAS